MGWSWNPREAYRMNGCGNPVDRERVRYGRDGRLVPDYHSRAVMPPDYRHPKTMPPEICGRKKPGITGYVGLTTVPYVKK